VLLNLNIPYLYYRYYNNFKDTRRRGLLIGIIINIINKTLLTTLKISIIYINHYPN